MVRARDCPSPLDTHATRLRQDFGGQARVRHGDGGHDRLGARQDSQRFYEDVATGDLVAHAGFDAARGVFEFGCGTGRFAEGLLSDHLPERASYRGIDLSSTMVDLASARLVRFGDRARVLRTDGVSVLDAPDGSFDRFVSNFVLDLLPNQDIRFVLAEAHRVLEPAGRVCLVSLTHGSTPVSRLLVRALSRVHAVRPILVGGCRPVELRDFLSTSVWRIDHLKVVTAFGVPSEVVVATKR